MTVVWRADDAKKAALIDTRLPDDYLGGVTVRLSIVVALICALSCSCLEVEELPGSPSDATSGDSALDGGLDELPDYNLAPTVVVTTPAPGATILEGDAIKLVGQVTDDRELASELQCRWVSDRDGDLGEVVPLDSGLTQRVVENLSAGPHILTLEAIDSEGLRGSAQGALLVNGAPSAPEVQIAPESPNQDDQLIATITSPAVDPNRASSELTLDWRWLRDGAAVTAATSAMVESSMTLPGEVWEVRVRAFDGLVFGPEGVASVTIGEVARTTP